VPEHCTCGAQLPPDARFCHKCGKPQREEPVIDQNELQLEPEAAPPVLPVAIAEPEPTRIGLGNPVAVRTGLLAGVIGLLALMLLGQIPGLQVLSLVMPVASGFLAVLLYRRRTHQALSIAGGAQLGWIAGMVGFIITILFVTMFVVMLTEPDVAQQMRMQAERSRPEVLEMIKLMQTPTGIAQTLLESLVLFALLPTLGGAVGAKLLGRPE
jgi:hypothetical protein